MFSTCNAQFSKNMVLTDYWENDKEGNYSLVFIDSVFMFNNLLYSEPNYTKVNNAFVNNIEFKNILKNIKYKSKIVEVNFDFNFVIQNINYLTNSNISNYFKLVFPDNKMDTTWDLYQNMIFYKKSATKDTLTINKIKRNKTFVLNFNPDTVRSYTKVNNIPKEKLKEKIESLRMNYTCEYNCCKSEKEDLLKVSYENILGSCTTRANYLDRVLSWYEIYGKKIFIEGLFNVKKRNGDVIQTGDHKPATWTSHVANLIVNVEEKDSTQDTLYYVLDFAASDTLLSIDEWLWWHTKKECILNGKPGTTWYSSCIVTNSGINLVNFQKTDTCRCDCLVNYSNRKGSDPFTIEYSPPYDELVLDVIFYTKCNLIISTFKYIRF